MGVQAIPFKLFQEAGIEKQNRSLVYDFNAMADFEQMTGMGLAQLMNTHAIFAVTRCLLWAGLKRRDRSLTVERAGQLIQDYVDTGHGQINTVLGACIEAAVEQGAIPNLVKKDGEDDESPEGNAGSAQPTGTQTAPGPVTSDTPQ